MTTKQLWTTFLIQEGGGGGGGGGGINLRDDVCGRNTLR